VRPLRLLESLKIGATTTLTQGGARPPDLKGLP